MLSDDVPDAYRMNADLIFLSLALSASSENKEGFFSDLFYRVCEKKRRSARSVRFSVVMLFDDLNVRFGERFRGGFCKFRK